MKIGELFINLGITGDIKPLKEALSGMDAAGTKAKLLKKYLNDLKNATTAEERATIKSNFAQKIRNLRTVEGIKVLGGLVGQVMRVVKVTAIAVVAFDRMANAVANANQKIINFHRQTGISISSLNKYASASAAVNYGATPESTAQSLQNVANNLWDIRMGRGDISPYQELAFVGGKPINVIGKSVEQVIEELRDAIKNVPDLQATNLITRMGFNAEDLAMLRMTKEEFAEIKSMFLTSDEQKELNKLSLELKKIHLELDLIYKRFVIKIMPFFLKIGKAISKTAQILYGFTQRLTSSKLELFAFTAGILGLAIALKGVLIPALIGLSKAIWGILTANPALLALVAALTTLFLLIDDYITWSQGGQSLFNWGEGNKPLIDPNAPDEEKISQYSKNKASASPWQTAFATSYGTPYNTSTIQPIGTSKINTSNATVTQNNNMTIHTSQVGQAVYNEMLPLTKQLNTIIGVNAAIGH